MKKINVNRQKMGLKPIDLERRERSLAKGLVNSMRAIKNPELQAKLNGELLASAKPTLDENEKDLLEKLKAKKKGGVEETKKEEDFMSGLNFNFQKEKEEGMADFDMEDDSGDRVEDLDIQVNDISKRENDSILRASPRDILSRRTPCYWKRFLNVLMISKATACKCGRKGKG